MCMGAIFISAGKGDNVMEIGKKLRNARTRSGFTQEKAAEEKKKAKKDGEKKAGEKDGKKKSEKKASAEGPEQGNEIGAKGRSHDEEKE